MVECQAFVDAPEVMYLRLTTPLLGFALAALLVGGCGAVSVDFGPRISQEDTKLIVEALIGDMPLPPGAEIRNRETVILGSGAGWAGRIGIDDKQTPAETLIFFRDAPPRNGWVMTSSTVGKDIVMVYEKPDRITTVEIAKGRVIGPETDITISVVPRVTMAP